MAENLSISEKLSDIQTTKTAIREAIVAKGVDMPEGTTFRQYSNKIDDIIGVPSLSNPGSAGDLRSGKQLVGADGSIVTGNLPEVIQATPTISVSSGGLITASATQSGGIVAGGTKSATQQLTTQGAKTVTPGTTAQTAVASGRYTTGDVVVAGDANLVPENIAEGVSIFGVQGTHSGGKVDTVFLTIEGNPTQTKITYYLNGEILTKGNLGYPATIEVDKGSLACTYGYPGFTNVSVSGGVVLINSVLEGNPMSGFTNSSNLIQINGDGTIRC